MRERDHDFDLSPTPRRTAAARRMLNFIGMSVVAIIIFRLLLELIAR